MCVSVCNGGNGVGGAETEKEEACKKENGRGGHRAEIGQVRQMEGVIGHCGALGQLLFDILVDTMT